MTHKYIKIEKIWIDEKGLTNIFYKEGDKLMTIYGGECYAELAPIKGATIMTINYECVQSPREYVYKEGIWKI